MYDKGQEGEEEVYYYVSFSVCEVVSHSLNADCGKLQMHIVNPRETTEVKRSMANKLIVEIK